MGDFNGTGNVKEVFEKSWPKCVDEEIEWTVTGLAA